ncbi:MAG: type II toxin-antitoxin system PemK/MazF family toxin [Candidatus Staskawiczbacteria bacterium]|nr:type II toxin-antitoxin system PemK/MazF family toxin [Candidatus Staskawiczbacteria bacterium]
MKKDYKKWMLEKAGINNDKVRPFFHEREVWFTSMGENIGFEQDGGGEKFLRPVLIFKKFNNEVIWALPLTRTDKKSKYYFNISINDNEASVNNRQSVVILSQIRLVDAKRLQYKIGTINENEFAKLKGALLALLK